MKNACNKANPWINEEVIKNVIIKIKKSDLRIVDLVFISLNEGLSSHIFKKLLRLTSSSKLSGFAVLFL